MVRLLTAFSCSKLLIAFHNRHAAIVSKASTRREEGRDKHYVQFCFMRRTSFSFCLSLFASRSGRCGRRRGAPLRKSKEAKYTSQHDARAGQNWKVLVWSHDPIFPTFPISFSR